LKILPLLLCKMPARLVPATGLQPRNRMNARLPTLKTAAESGQPGRGSSRFQNLCLESLADIDAGIGGFRHELAAVAARCRSSPRGCSVCPASARSSPVQPNFAATSAILERAKWAAVAELCNTQALSVILPWADIFVQDVRAVMGEDYCPFGLAANRKPLEAILRWLKDQAPIDAAPPFASLFAEAARDWTPDKSLRNQEGMHHG
jgi:hypothetical protein